MEDMVQGRGTDCGSSPGVATEGIEGWKGMVKANE